MTEKHRSMSATCLSLIPKLMCDIILPARVYVVIVNLVPRHLHAIPYLISCTKSFKTSHGFPTMSNVPTRDVLYLPAGSTLVRHFFIFVTNAVTMACFWYTPLMLLYLALPSHTYTIQEHICRLPAPSCCSRPPSSEQLPPTLNRSLANPTAPAPRTHAGHKSTKEHLHYTQTILQSRSCDDSCY